MLHECSKTNSWADFLLIHMIDEDALNIYTDGSSRPTPRRGGVGIRYIYCDENGNEVRENFPLPGYLGATSNEMELKAVIIALRKTPPYLQTRRFKKIIVHSDSRYVIDNSATAFFIWPKTKWIKKAGGPVLTPI